MSDQTNEEIREYEEAQCAYRNDEITDGPEHQGWCDEETDAERNR